MTVLDSVNTDFKALLKSYPGGISNTSTRKYNGIRHTVAAGLGLASDDDVYITGATTRISNLDTRFAQGNQRNQHAPLAIGFIQKFSGGRARNVVIADAAASAKTTSEKFVNGAERGTTFDGVLCLLQVDNEDAVEPLLFIHSQFCQFAASIPVEFPGIQVHPVHRATAPIAAGAPLAHGPAAGPPQMMSAALAKKCAADLKSAGLVFPDGLVERYLAALLVKRFVILAGLSGSGKTKIALAIARWFQEKEEQVQVVAVGSDWMNNENILGYHDALETARYRRPANGALDTMLAAMADPTRPYFLILDEMNLSHVERYFADILSAIESEQPMSLHAFDGYVDGVPSKLLLPSNLFIVGTVNVDETTYMFSPKVLDRANVIEFRVPQKLIESFLLLPAAIDLSSLGSEGASFAESFVQAASYEAIDYGSLSADITNGADINELLRRSLVELFGLLEAVGGEFGFRVALEVHRFVFFHALLTGAGWKLEHAIDAQLLQKLMPKLHGPERRLGPVLTQLAAFCDAHNCELSRRKIDRMANRVRDGFATYLDP